MKNFQYSVDEINAIMTTKAEIEKVEKQHEEIKNFEQDISYLQQCKQYLPGDELKDKITQNFNRLTEVFSAEDEKKIKQYKKDLGALKEKYAAWYLDQYLKYRISEADNTQKQALLDSDDKVICDILQEADFLSSGQYRQLIDKLNKLQLADAKVNKNLILTAPYQDFNPLDYLEQEPDSIRILKIELEDLKESWIQTLKDTLDDPAVLKKMELLDKSTAGLLNDFKTGKVALDSNNALTIRNAIMNLHNGLEKVELSTEGLKTTFNKPLTPDEAVDAFKKYIDEVTRGKERNKVRIILK